MEMAEPLFNAIWPPHVVATLPWADIVFAHAELRVLVRDDADDVICHVGIYRRDVTWTAASCAPAASAGFDPRGCQGARLCLDCAERCDPDPEDERSIDFALLFCEPYRARSTSRADGSRSLARSTPNSRTRDAFASKPLRRMSTTSAARSGRV